MRTHNISLVKDNRKDISILLPDLALRLTLTSSNYPCFEHIFLVPKVFEPWKFDCIFLKISSSAMLSDFVIPSNIL